MQIDNDDENIDPSRTGQDYVDAVNEKNAAQAAAAQAASQPVEGPQMVRGMNPAIAQPRQPQVSAARQEINRIKEEQERKEQEKKDADELKKIQFYKKLEEEHPTLVKGARLGAKILGVASQKIDSAGGRFIQDQNAADRVMRKNSNMRLPGTKKVAKRSPSDDDEIEDEGEEFVGMGKSRSGSGRPTFPNREFDSGSTLPKAAYLPKDQFGREYKSVGVPVSLRMTGSKSSSGIPPMPGPGGKGIKGMPMLPGGKGKKGGMMMLDEAMHHGMTEPSDNSGMGEYKSIGNPVTLKGGVAMGNFRNVPVPNSLAGITLGGFGQRPQPRTIPLPVMTKENISLPPPIPLKKKGK